MALRFNGSAAWYAPFRAENRVPVGISVVTWFYLDATGANQMFVGRDENEEAGPARCYQFRVSSANQIQPIIYYNGGTTAFGSGTTTLSTGSWHHMAMTHDGATLRGYLDGVEEVTETAAGDNDSFDIGITLGGRSRNAATDDVSERLTGRLRQTAEYGTVLTPGDVRDLSQGRARPEDVQPEYITWQHPGENLYGSKGTDLLLKPEAWRAVTDVGISAPTIDTEGQFVNAAPISDFPPYAAPAPSGSAYSLGFII